jgi:hypothetical protein
LRKDFLLLGHYRYTSYVELIATAINGPRSGEMLVGDLAAVNASAGTAAADQFGPDHLNI